MQIEKEKVLKIANQDYFVVDYLFYRGAHYILAAPLEEGQELGKELIIFEEVRDNQQLFIKKVKDEQILKYVCPIFEHNLKINLI